MHRRSLVALSAGISVVWLTQWALLHGVGFSAAWAEANPVWYNAIMFAFFPIALVVPGFCTGWLSGRHGIRLGALTGFIGSVTVNAAGLLFRLHPKFSAFLTSDGVLITLAAALGLALTCAAGGGTGELLRSNNRWRGS